MSLYYFEKKSNFGYNYQPKQLDHVSKKVNLSKR